MPRKQITFIIIPPNDGQVQEYKLLSHLLWLGGVLGIAVVSALSYYAIKFHTSVDQTREISALMEQNDQLVRSLDGARRDVGQLEDLMGHLAKQDQRLRDFHEMAPMRDESLLLGVGGPEEPGDLPEDYTGMPARKRALLEDLSMRVDRLKREALYQQSSFQALIDTFMKSQENLSYVPTIWPADPSRTWVSSAFGTRTDPFTGKPAWHSGLDLAGRRGLKVWATADGIVALAYEDQRLGRVVVINHDPVVLDENGREVRDANHEPLSRPGILRTEYGHLDKILVTKGQRVKRGDEIGLMGSTGRSTGPHLHYAIRYQERGRGGVRGYKDPREYMLDWSNDDRAAASVAARTGG